MKWSRVSLFLLMALVLAAIPSSRSFATSSEEFYDKGGHVFDQWRVARTRGYGEDGFFQVMSETRFRPIIAFESLGDNIERAYRLGEEFLAKYTDPNQRAERIFSFVKERVRYTSDSDQFKVKEFAQNADEVLAVIEEKGVAYGDCEDSAVLFAVMLKGAGLRSAIVLAPGHAAALVYLPGYRRANQVFELKGEKGWVWAEATSRNNPLGWTPEQVSGERMIAYEVSAEEIVVPEGQPEALTTTVSGGGGGGGLPLRISPFFSVIGIMWLLSMFRRRRR